MKIGIVLPRYLAHTTITAGAERIGEAIAHRLAGRGHDVEVLATCAQDMLAPRNVIAPGLSRDGAVGVRAFELDLQHWNASRYQALTHRWIQGMAHSLSAEDEWLDALPHASRLYEYLDRHQSEYDVLLFTPYLAATTLYGGMLCVNRAAIMPALHDEPFARMQMVRALLSQARRVLYMTAPEQDLAQRTLHITPKCASVVGVGVDDARADVSAERFRRRFNLHKPLVLYSGRIESAKNVHLLLTYIDTFHRRYPQHADVVFALQGTIGMPGDAAPIRACAATPSPGRARCLCGGCRVVPAVALRSVLDCVDGRLVIGRGRAGACRL